MLKNLIHIYWQMDQIRKRYLGLTLSIFLVFAFLLASTFALQFDKINEIHAINTQDQIIEIKKDFLEDTVNNTIRYIEEIKELNESRLKSRINRLISFIDDHTDYFAIDHILDYVELDSVNENIVIIVKDELGQTLFESPTAIEHKSNLLDQDYLVYEEIEYENYTIFVGALNSCVRNLVESSLRNRVYNDFYFEDSYIWVNEIINYNGGNDYGRRLIHPNLKDTEGLLLSTDMQDIAGGKPYLEELEGVRDNGELFFSYYFKKLNTDTIEKKITYAKLYAEYDWIIAMGVYYDNIEEYIAKASDETQNERNLALSVVGLISLALILIGTVIILYIEKSYYLKSTKPLKTQVDTDLLTGAGSRRSGLKSLENGFDDFKSNGGIYSLLVIDLDDFKKINDKHGHAVGDEALKNVVASIKNVIRKEDKIYRWGGEEFIIFTKGVSGDNLDTFMDKVLRAVEESSYIKDGEQIKTTISIGATHFLESDESYEQALNRGDIGLYKSKRAGKNKATKVF